jgi:hypothetical protein
MPRAEAASGFSGAVKMIRGNSDHVMLTATPMKEIEIFDFAGHRFFCATDTGTGSVLSTSLAKVFFQLQQLLLCF